MKKVMTLLACALVSCAWGEGGKPVEVMAVYYPHWHRYPKGDEWFGTNRWNEGEWEFVRTAKPRFPGHRQPIKPLPGYLNGKDPADVATEIELASNAGIGIFLYDYYYYDGQVTQEEAIEEGFLKAANRSKMKFALMWCYHERNRGGVRPRPANAGGRVAEGSNARRDVLREVPGNLLIEGRHLPQGNP